MKSLTVAGVILLGVTVGVLVGCSASGGQPTAHPVLQREAEGAVGGDPPATGPSWQMRYSIVIVKPDPSIEYTIITVAPDPSIDYQIIVVAPTCAKDGRRLLPLDGVSGDRHTGSSEDGSAVRRRFEGGWAR